MATEIPKQLWYVKAGDSDLAYVTGYEDNAAGRKRQETGLRWAGKGRIEYVRDANGAYLRNDQGGYVTKPLPDPVGAVVDNKPIKGWKIADKAVRWTTSNVVWRIESPHGFTFEIYSGNMMEIIKCATIKNGEIMDECVVGKGNILLPITSDPYKEAKKFTDLKENKSGKPSQLVPGDVVTLVNGQEYKFLGRLYCLQFHNDNVGNDTVSSFRWYDKPLYFFKNNSTTDTYIEGIKAPKILKIESSPEDTDFISEIHSKDYLHTGSVRDVVAVAKTPCDYKIVTEYFDMDTNLSPYVPMLINDYFYVSSYDTVNGNNINYTGYGCAISDKTIKFLEPSKWVTSRYHAGNGYMDRNPIKIEKSDVFNMSKMLLEVDGKRTNLKRLIY